MRLRITPPFGFTCIGLMNTFFTFALDFHSFTMSGEIGNFQ